jgi:hypothetical protein
MLKYYYSKKLIRGSQFDYYYYNPFTSYFDFSPPQSPSPPPPIHTTQKPVD